MDTLGAARHGKWSISKSARGKSSTRVCSMHFQRRPREAFVPPEYRELAFADAPIPIGFGQSMLSPKLQGRILQASGASAADDVLEAGSGTGYLAACFSLLGVLDPLDRYSPRSRRIEPREPARAAGGEG